MVDLGRTPYGAHNGNPVFWADPSGADVIHTSDGITATGADAGALYSAILAAMDNGASSFEVQGKLYNQFVDILPGGGGGGPGGPINYKEYFQEKLQAIDDFTSKYGNIRNLLRFDFNNLELMGTTVEALSLLALPLTDGLSAPFGEIGFYINAAGTFGNSGIDFYDGRYGYGIFRLAKLFAFHGLGNVINTVSYGYTDKILLNASSYFYSEYVMPLMGDNIKNNFMTPIQNQFTPVEWTINVPTLK